MKPTAQESQALQAYRQGNQDPQVRWVVSEYHNRCGVAIAPQSANETKAQHEALDALYLLNSQAADRLRLKSDKALLGGFNVAAEAYLAESEKYQAKASRFQALGDRLAYLIAKA